MRSILPENLIALAKLCPAPLYVVGGSVRDFLLGIAPLNAERDWDLASPTPVDDFLAVAQNAGFTAKAVYKNTGTVKLCDGNGTDYEYSCFRSDNYVRGVHTPVEIYFTNDIVLDARRRDFTANAVYYDIAAERFVDPLDGIPAIREKRLTTVAPASKVFGEDGLRLMRLARQSATLGFTPDEQCLQGAQLNAALINDISPQRIFAELSAILSADEKYGVKDGHYQGLRVLERTGVLAQILPELAEGKNMAQRADFHKYDVLEHSFRAVLYADKTIRFAALLHDVGKPVCMRRDGNSYNHVEEGAILARNILNRLCAPKRLIDETATLVALHMYDFNCLVKENKLRRFFVNHYEFLDKLLLLKQADYTACTDDFSVAPTCARWTALLTQMRAEKAPMRLKELAVTGKDILAACIPAQRVSAVLHALLLHVAIQPSDNDKTRLCKLAVSFLNAMNNQNV